jgi:DNA repair protein RecO (recombination protein O)
MTSRRHAAAPLAAYVLHRWDWSESSLIVELFTRSQGRVVVAAKGAKRPTSQLRPVLLPFQRILVLLSRAPADEAAEVHTLRSAEWGGGAPMIAGAALFRGFYANELLMKLLARQDPHPELFDAYAGTLPALGGDEATAAAALRAFELVLLRETGVLPDLSMLTQTAAPLAAAGRYALHPEAGVTTAAGAAAVEGRIFVAIEQALAVRDRAALQAACRGALAPLRAQLRDSVDYHLGRAVLRTRQVMLDVRRLTEPPSPARR